MPNFNKENAVNFISFVRKNRIEPTENLKIFDMESQTFAIKLLDHHAYKQFEPDNITIACFNVILGSKVN